MTAVRVTDDAGTRRCIVARTVEARAGLVRFVAHGTEVVPDLADRLPGRGAWVGAQRGRIDEAVRRNLFSRAFRRQVVPAPDLAGHVEELVAKRVVELVGLARRSGHAVHGRDRCLKALQAGVAGLLIVADDAGSETRRMQRAAGASGVTTGTGPCKTALGIPFGVDSAAYVAIWAGSLCDRIERDLQRLAGLRPAVHGNQA